MCTLSVRMDDKVLDRVKPLFGGDKAMNKWIETVLHKAMEEYAEQYEQMAGKNWTTPASRRWRRCASAMARE